MDKYFKNSNKPIQEQGETGEVNGGYSGSEVENDTAILDEGLGQASLRRKQMSRDVKM